LKVNAPETAAGRLQATVRKDGAALVTGVLTQRFARMWYVVTGLVPARIEVRPSNGLGSDNPDLECRMQLGSNDKQSTSNRITG
jgi:hypothetical protein